MTALAARRVVSGLDDQGRSAVVIDGPLRDMGGGGARLVWRTTGLPADNAHAGDCEAGQFGFEQMHAGGSMFMVMDFAPGQPEFWHATDTLEYIVMLSGEVAFQTATGEVTLTAGDCLVDRGIVHSWRNDSGAPARAAIVVLPARPVGKGRTV
ncbi:MAG TPA: cupin domain-containing protein [Novosphingobium sp.]|nr:cupin domain-containing protein [Novosphingobium sp.]